MWNTTKFLLDGESNRQAVKLLDEFVKDRRSLERMSATQRALMQRDLLGVFGWLVNEDHGGQNGLTSQQRELAKRLARAIRLVALTEKEIQKLPDNYASAIASPEVATAFDPEHPQRAFLPKDLLSDDGPWIALVPQGDDGLAATVHFKAFYGRSAFDVRMRHPDGRVAGEAYLQELAKMPNPLILKKPEKLDHFLPHSDPEYGPWPNPNTPHFPTNTMWALVRRAVLADADGNPVVSPIVESIQIRIYRAIDPDARRAQTFFEWELRRALLLGKGGFHLTKPEDQEYPHFLSHGTDPFELAGGRIRPEQKPSTLNCFGCHGGLGVHSVLSRARLFELQLSRPPEFHAVSRARIEQMTEIEARRLPNWQLLRWIMREK